MKNSVRTKIATGKRTSKPKETPVSPRNRKKTPFLKKLEIWYGTVDFILVKTFILSLTAYKMVDFFVGLIIQ